MEDPYILDTSFFNDLRGVKRSDNSSMFDEMIRIFFRDGPKSFQALAEAIEIGDLRTTADRAHALRGSARLFGATAFSKALEQLESRANRGLVEAARKSFEEAEPAFNSMLEQLRKLSPTD